MRRISLTFIIFPFYHESSCFLGRHSYLYSGAIDAPETKGQDWEAQPWSRKSTDYLRSILPPGKVCIAKVLDVDRYGREVALLSLDGVGLVQDAMLTEGLAWVYEKYCTEQPLCGKLKRVETAARDSKRGLWRDEDRVPP